ncbi:MAG: hypothetical protein V5A23_02450 [Halobacteriales archaeon]
MPELDNGEVIDLTDYYTNVSRRTMLKLSGGVAAAGLSLPTLVERAYGTQPEDKVLVLTRDQKGRPAKVKSVHPERYRRIKAFSRFDTGAIAKRNKHISGVTLRQRSSDSTDLAIQINIRLPKRDTSKKKTGNKDELRQEIVRKADVPAEPRKLTGIKKALPEGASDVPLEYRGDTTQKTKKQSLEGGAELEKQERGLLGTVGLVCYGEVLGTQNLLTAKHVADAETNDEVIYNGKEITNVAFEDEGQDAISFNFADDDFNTDPLGITGWNTQVDGYWTFDGLSDQTGWLNSVDFRLYGQKSGKVEGKVDKTKKDGLLGDRLAHTEKERTKSGDSGGPYVDTDDYFIGHHLGINCGAFTCWSVLSVAGPTFNRVNLTLDPNSDDQTK